MWGDILQEHDAVEKRDEGLLVSGVPDLHTVRFAAIHGKRDYNDNS